MPKRRSRRLATRAGAIAACVMGLTSYATSAVAADRTVHGSATVMNACSVSILPALIPSPASHRVTVGVTSDAGPQPFGAGPITLSNTSVEIKIGAHLFQGAVDSGFIGDGFTIPATISVTIAGPHTNEAVRTFTQSTTLALHVVSGDAETLVATLHLPDSVWHPASPGAADVFFSEKSARVVLTLDLSATVGATLVHTSTCTPMSVTPFVALASEMEGPPPPLPTSTTQVPPTTLTAPVTIGQIEAELPHTGSDSGYAVFFALSCLGAGALLLGLSRKRRPE